MKVVARIDKNCTGRKQHYTIGDKTSEVSGGLYVPREKKPPRKITVIFEKENRKITDQSDATSTLEHNTGTRDALRKLEVTSEVDK